VLRVVLAAAVLGVGAPAAAQSATFAPAFA
jgi:hypothetical protein